MSEQHQLPSAPPQYSPDGRWWWDGGQWVPVGANPASSRSRLWLGIALGIVGVLVLGLIAAMVSMPIGSQTHGDKKFDREYCQVFPEDC